MHPPGHPIPTFPYFKQSFFYLFLFFPGFWPRHFKREERTPPFRFIYYICLYTNTKTLAFSCTSHSKSAIQALAFSGTAFKEIILTVGNPMLARFLASDLSSRRKTVTCTAQQTLLSFLRLKQLG